ncbi:hypothetical protein YASMINEVIRUS_1282 [Yasminevirus sp. GU-2018]|uniref:Uncharacterized protein n=1 Tax=Yasminevirus sp. GU-2018 TaxID=2420051 RepID=A0A5K0UAN4_9VIRU|nr:hypothetical protein YASMINEVIRUS_1282 [Yasminevirus sp. GU-2018]
MKFSPNSDEYLPYKREEHESETQSKEYYITRHTGRFGVVVGGACRRSDSVRSNSGRDMTMYPDYGIDKVVVRDGKIVEPFILKNLDYVSIRDTILYCNEPSLFDKNELWNVNEPSSDIRLSFIVQRLGDRNISGDFIVVACRSGDIWGEDLHLQACRQFAKSHMEESGELESVKKIEVTPERMMLARRDSGFFSVKDFYDEVFEFNNYFFMNLEGPVKFSDNKLQIGDLILSVPSSILNRYKTDSGMNKKIKYATYVRSKDGSSTRTVDKRWYSEFERNIVDYIRIFLQNMTMRVDNCVPIHTVEYCRLYSLVHSKVLPYISTLAVDCFVNKKMYLRICMTK